MTPSQALCLQGCPSATHVTASQTRYSQVMSNSTVTRWSLQGHLSSHVVSEGKEAFLRKCLGTRVTPEEGQGTTACQGH